jgi:hypothetical protein
MSLKASGQLRRSQVIRTFGPGSMLDLPKRSVLIGGLDEWMGVDREIHEPRLKQKVELVLGIPNLRLMTPPPEQDDPSGPKTGLRVWEFPTWYIVQDIEYGQKGLFERRRRLVPQDALTSGKYRDENRKLQAVVPVRFVRACPSGHIGDINWYEFVHQGRTDCRRELWIDERGTSGDLGDVWVRCDCKAERQMGDATNFGTYPLGHCDGARPWLGKALTRESCSLPNRLLIRSASNAYLPQVLSVISLPDSGRDLAEVVTTLWEFLELVENIDDLQREMRRDRVRRALQGFTEDRILAEILGRKRTGAEAQQRSVKSVELDTLIGTGAMIGDDSPDSIFHAEQLAQTEWYHPWTCGLERVLLIHRLREVSALVGFTRFESSAPDIQGELDMQVKRAAIALEQSWVPAIENRGEGIFLGFRKAAIDAWLQRPDVRARAEGLVRGFERWRSERELPQRQFPGPAYVMLHSLSHLLITAVALECGYPASSIRERIYAIDGRYGILLYTASPDAEGTLGGLVETGRHITDHLAGALQAGGLCSNDPVCAQHAPEDLHEARYLMGAACHGCVLISETSCENFNEYLDRALVVPTVGDEAAAFFEPA